MTSAAVASVCLTLSPSLRLLCVLIHCHSASDHAALFDLPAVTWHHRDKIYQDFLQITFSGPVEREIDAPEKRRDNEMIIISLITVIYTWCGSAGRSLTTTQLTGRPLLINCGWLRSSRCWSRAGTKSELAKHLLKRLKLAHNSFTPTIEATDIHWLFLSVLFLFCE